MKELRTADEVIAALGGDKAVRALTGGKPTAVSNWRVFGKFPARKYVIMTRALHKRGLSAPPSLWGQEDRPHMGVMAR